MPGPAGEEESEKKYTAKFRETPPPQAFFQLYDEEDAVWGVRPAALLEPRPQDRVERHHGEHIDEICPFVPILDVPVPQMGAQVVEFMHAIDTAIPEQVIEVPRLSPDRIPQRSLDRRPQSAEQLVEVPTNPGYVLAVIAKKFLTRRQIISIQSEGPSESSEQNIDIPVPRGRRGRENSSRNSTAAGVEQNVNIPPRGGLEGFPPRSGTWWLTSLSWRRCKFPGYFLRLSSCCTLTWWSMSLLCWSSWVLWCCS